MLSEEDLEKIRMVVRKEIQICVNAILYIAVLFAILWAIFHYVGGLLGTILEIAVFIAGLALIGKFELP